MFVNLTAMCREFGKHAGHFLTLRQSKDCIQYWAEETGISPDRLVVKTKSPKSNVWAHRCIALECAHWLSVPFRIWRNRVGYETPGPHLSDYQGVLQALADKVEAEARSAARRLKVIQLLNNPDRLPGLPWPPRRVHAAVIEEDYA
jgi:hypothetical protein